MDNSGTNHNTSNHKYVCLGYKYHITPKTSHKLCCLAWNPSFIECIHVESENGQRYNSWYFHCAELGQKIDGVCENNHQSYNENAIIDHPFDAIDCHHANSHPKYDSSTYLNHKKVEVLPKSSRLLNFLIVLDTSESTCINYTISTQVQ